MSGTDYPAALLERVGAAYERLEPDEAQRCLQQAHEAASRADLSGTDPTWRWRVWWRARLSELRGDLDVAQRAASQTISEARDQGWHGLQPHALVLLASILLEQGDELGAEPVAKRAHTALQGLGDAADVAHATIALGRIRLEQGRTQDAVDVLLPAEQLLQALADPRSVDASVALAQAYRRRGEVTLAEATLQQALARTQPAQVRHQLRLWTALASNAVETEHPRRARRLYELEQAQWRTLGRRGSARHARDRARQVSP